MTNRQPHVVHLSSVHPPFDIRVFEKECRSLAAAGYRVTYVVPHSESGTVDNVRIHAIPRPATRRERMLSTTRRILSAALELDANLYHFHDPELIPVGFALKSRGKRVVYDVHENLPGDLLHSKAYVPRWLKSPLSASAAGLEALAAMAFDGIVTITQGFAERFPSEKTCVVSNYPVLNGTRHEELPPHANRERLVVFTGGLSEERCASAIVEGVGRAATVQPARLVVAGALESDRLLETLRSGPGGSVLDYRGTMNRGGVEALLSRARVALLTTALRPDFKDISSNKLYEYMLFGLPVVASPIQSWRADIERIGAGIALRDNSAEAVAEAVSWLLEHPRESEEMGRRGAAAVMGEYNWGPQAAKLVKFYENLLAGSRRPAVTSPR